MSKKTQPTKPIVPNSLPRLMRELIAAGLARQEELKLELSGGLILKFRPPDETNVSCRLLAYRLDVQPSVIEVGVVKRELDKLTNGSPVNGPGEPFWHKNFGCYLFAWSPDPAKVQLELFGGAG